MYEVIKYGVVGFSKNQFDQKAAYKLLDSLFLQLRKKHSNEIIEIVSGYTKSGIPKISYELAEKYDFVTVGYSAAQAHQVTSGVYPVNKVFIVGERFGDESAEFIKYIDRLIRVGGGPQSRNEVELFKVKNQNKPIEELLIEYEIEWYGD